MTTPRNGSAQRLEVGDAAERARVREAQHATLADLLGAYADGELPVESAARVEAHLVGCVRCRRDLATQTALRDRLAAEAVLPAPAALRDRIFAATAAAPPAPELLASLAAATRGAATPDTPADTPAGAPASARAAALRASPRRRWWMAVSAAAALAAGAGGGVAVWRARPAARDAAIAAYAARPTPAGRVPLMTAALADYRRSTAGDLPGRARDLDALRGAVGFAVEPLRAPGFSLLAAWTTTLDGEPAAVLAYRRGDHLVLQYRVPEAVFFRYAALRSATAAHRPVAAVDGVQGVLAWAEAASGVVLVSDDTPAQLMASLRPLPFGAPPAGPAPAQ